MKGQLDDHEEIVALRNDILAMSLERASLVGRHVETEVEIEKLKADAELAADPDAVLRAGARVIRQKFYALVKGTPVAVD